MPRKAAKPKPVNQVHLILQEMAETESDVRITLTPVQLLGVMMKAVLRDRIKDEEVDQICSLYYYGMSEASRNRNVS